MFVIHQHNFFLSQPVRLKHNLVFQLYVVQLQDAEINKYLNMPKLLCLKNYLNKIY